MGFLSKPTISPTNLTQKLKFPPLTLKSLRESVYFSAVGADPELVRVIRAVAGSQRILHLVTNPYKLGLSPGYKEETEYGELKG